MNKLDLTLMNTAEVWAQASYCKRQKVGAVIARDGRIIATGYNGTLPGDDNCCECSDGATKRTVMHAEANALLFCAKHGLSTKDCSLYVTMSPCIECTKLIISAGIKEVIFRDVYRDAGGITVLREFGLDVRRIDNV